MSARLPVLKNISKFDFLPDWISRNSGEVYKYWIDPDYQPPDVKSTSDSDLSYNFWDLELDKMNVRNQTNANISFEKGKYIRWNPTSKPTLYRISDHPNIFLEFAAIGKEVEPDEKKVKKFIEKYGIPRTGFNSPINETSYVFGQKGFYPLDTFCEYANEAYYVLSLYEALTNKDIKHLRESFLKGFDFGCLYGLYQEEFDIGRLIDIPVSIKDKYLGNWDRKITDKQAKLNLLINNIDPWETFLYSSDIDEVYDKIWADVINEASLQYLMELAATALWFIVDFRIRGNVGCAMNIISPQENGLGIYTFEDIWGGEDLLSKMWFTFFLKITGKLKQEYRICPACGELIIPKEGKKLRKNQVYCPGCRQMMHNRKVREVQKLWRDGLTIEEIKINTGNSVENIKKWIKN